MTRSGNCLLNEANVQKDLTLPFSCGRRLEQTCKRSLQVVRLTDGFGIAVMESRQCCETHASESDLPSWVMLRTPPDVKLRAMLS